MLQAHPEPALTSAWKWTQVGVICLPFSLTLGAICFLVSLIQVSIHRAAQLKQRKLNGVLLALTGGLLISTVYAQDPRLSALGLANFMPCFWCFAGFRELLQTPTQLRRLAWLLILPSLPIVLIGLGALYGLWWGPVQVPGMVDWLLEAGGTPIGRLAGIFAYANVLGSYLHVNFTLTLGLLLDIWLSPQVSSAIPTLVLDSDVSGSDVSGSDVLGSDAGNSGSGNAGKRSKSRQSMFLTILLITLLLVEGIGLVLTQSRNAWGVALVTVISFGVYLRWYRILGFLFGLMASVLWAAFGTIGQTFFQKIIPAFFWSRLNDQQFPDRPLADLRLTQWQFAWSMTVDRPWTGWGLRNFTPLYEAQMHTWLGHPHNFFLMLSAETGLPVTLVFLGLVGWIMGESLVRGWRSPLRSRRDRALLFTYWLAFGGCVLFSGLDVTFFDFRINLINWLLLASLAGASLAGVGGSSLGQGGEQTGGHDTQEGTAL